MNVQTSRRLFITLAVAVGGLLAGGAMTLAAPVAAKLELSALRCIKTNNGSLKADDQVYMTVTGVAKGSDVTKRVPESGTVAANKKVQPVKQPVTLWEGELADGEFALVTVALYQGKGDDDAAKAFDKQLADAVKGVAERSKKTLTGADAKTLAEATVKAQRGVVEKVKESLNRTKKTDAYVGLFNVLVLNDGGKLVKRLDPVGLTFGEHFGTDEKIYSKIKYTMNNVLVPEGEAEDAEWYPQVFPPVSEDKQTVRVKMLETEYFEDASTKRRKRQVTDYLADLKLTVGGKPAEWKLVGEHIGPSQTHLWWDRAE